jgi:hypothetical protein
VEKTEYKLVAQVETISILPRTLEISPESMRVPGADTTIYPVYGRDINDRRVWCATFVDAHEAQVWIQCSKTFGRPVVGAVMAGQQKAEKGAELSDDAVAIGNESSGPAGQAN